MLKFVLEIGPLAVFFLAYKAYDLLLATACLIIATLLSLAITYLWKRELAIMPIVTAVMVAVFGGLTLWLDDELFIKMKPTIVNLIFAAALLFGAYALKKPLIKYLLGEALTLTEGGWMKLSVRWGWYFVFLAALNEVIWRSFSTDFWVNFKVFGMFTCTLLFTLAQIPLMKREMIEAEKN